MALVLANRVQETTTTTGTGTVTLAGAMSGFQSFAVVGNTNTTYYAITSGTAWEVGIGTYSTTGPTLARTTILSSSIGGGAITLAGTSIVFATYPSEKSVNYDASSNVGIGTTSPASKLDIASGDLRFSSTGQRILGDMSTSTIANRFAFQTTTVNGNTNLHITPNGSATQSGFKAETDSTFTTGQLLSIDIVGGSDARFNCSIRGAGTYVPITFYTGGSERVRVDTAGNLGVGTTAPGYKLTVAGASGTAVVSLLETGVRSWGIRAGGAATDTFDIADFTAGTSRFLITSTGDVGIGTTSPASKLNVSGGNVTVSAGYGIAWSGDQTRIMTPEDNVSGALINWAAAGICRFIGGTSERMRIDGSGNVGIGTSSPGVPFQVSKTGVDSGVGFYTISKFLDGSSNKGLQIGYDNAAQTAILVSNTTSASSNMAFWTYEAGVSGWAERMRITAAGNVGIGTASPGSKLNVDGGSLATSGAGILAAGSISTGRLISGGGATVNAIHTYYDDRAYELSAGSTSGYVSGVVVGARSYTGTGGDAVTLWTRSAERMRIDSSGNVGIGTSSPAGKLDVNGSLLTSDITSRGNGTEGGQVTLNNAANSAGVYFFDVDGSGHGRVFTVTNNTNLSLGQLAGTGGVVTVATSAAERMRIDSSGNVGIGTTAPQGKMEIRTSTGGSVTNALTLSNYVASTVNTGVGLYFDPNGAGSVARAASIQSVQATSGNFADLRFFTSNSDTPAERMKITPGGVVAIGGGTINSALGDMVLSKQSAGTATFALESQGSWNSTIASSAAGDMIFSNPAATERMRIVAGGNIGIGTTAPGYPFVVVANSSTQAVRLAGRAADGIATLEFTSNNQGTTQAYIQAGATFLFFGTGTTEQFRILSTGGITSASVADAVGYKGLPQNSQTASYTLALTDMGKMVNTTTGGVIIPANSSVAFPIGSTVVVYNNSASSQTISITTDTLYLAGTATTGSRTLAQRGLATCVKVASTTWVVSGNVT